MQIGFYDILLFVISYALEKSCFFENHCYNCGYDCGYDCCYDHSSVFAVTIMVTIVVTIITMMVTIVTMRKIHGYGFS